MCVGVCIGAVLMGVCWCLLVSGCCVLFVDSAPTPAALGLSQVPPCPSARCGSSQNPVAPPSTTDNNTDDDVPKSLQGVVGYTPTVDDVRAGGQCR